MVKNKSISKLPKDKKISTPNNIIDKLILNDNHLPVNLLTESVVYKYELKLDRAIKISLPDCYSLYIPSQSTLQGYITTESLRDFLVTLGLIVNEGYDFNLSFTPCTSQLEWFSGIVITDEEIKGREYKMEMFIKERWGFYSTEILIPEWIDYLLHMIFEYKESLIT